MNPQYLTIDFHSHVLPSMDDGSQEYTIYTSVYSASNNELYVRTYEDQELTMFNLAKEDLNSEYINTYDISFTQKVSEIN